jgi:GNAT superfamily N-acetyltransferase
VAIWTIERLTSDHDRSDFRCGSEALDRYLKERAGQDSRRLFASVFVALEPSERRIVGYYAISAFGIVPSTFPEAIASRLPRYPLVPAFLLGRLAVDQRHQGRKLGKYLLLDALYRSYRQSVDHISGAFVVVDAIDENAVACYRRFHFETFPEPLNRLFLPMHTIARLFDEP